MVGRGATLKLRLAALILTLLLLSIMSVQAQDVAKWTFMLYWTADTSNIEDGMMMDINEIESVGSTADVNFVAQVDRTEADSRWTEARRLLLTQDNDPNHVNSEVLESLGEVNQGEQQTLVDFATWTAENFPAEHYALILNDHGGGWTGFGWDQTDFDDNLQMWEFNYALTSITEALGRKLDIIGFDACLMSQYEVIKLLSPYADYAILAEETEPGYGWSYDNSLPVLVDNPDMDAADLSAQFVDDYFTSYSTGDHRNAGYKKYDLNAIDLSAVPAVDTAMNAFAIAVQDNIGDVMSAIGDARNNAQYFAGNTPDEADDQSSIDLIDFLNLLTQFSDNEAVNEAAVNLRDAVAALPIQRKASGALPGANGVSIYFPRNQGIYDNNQLYNDYPWSVDYLPDWQSFLAMFYGQAVAAIPPSAAADAGATVVDILGVYPGEPLSIHNPPVMLFSTDWHDIVEVTFAASYLFGDGTQMMLDESPLQSAEVLASGEAVIDFPDGYQQNEFTWGVEMPMVTDGNMGIATLLLFNPDTPDQATISGQYTYQDGHQVTAYIAFDLATRAATNVWGVSEKAGNVPFNIKPEAGDQFLPTWRFLDENGEYIITPAEADPLIFGDQPFTFSYEPAISGDYELSIRVEDVAGNVYTARQTITIDNEELDTAFRGFTDIENGVTFLYPWGWSEPTYFTDEEAGTTQTIISNDDSSINIYLMTHDVASRDELLEIAQAYVDNIQESAVGESGTQTLGDYEADFIQYTFTLDDLPHYGTVLSIYIPEIEKGFVIDLDTTEEMQDEAENVLNRLAASLSFFTLAELPEAETE